MALCACIRPSLILLMTSMPDMVAIFSQDHTPKKMSDAGDDCSLEKWNAQQISGSSKRASQRNKYDSSLGNCAISHSPTGQRGSVQPQLFYVWGRFGVGSTLVIGNIPEPYTAFASEHLPCVFSMWMWKLNMCNIWNTIPIVNKNYSPVWFLAWNKTIWEYFPFFWSTRSEFLVLNYLDLGMSSKYYTMSMGGNLASVDRDFIQWFQGFSYIPDVEFEVPLWCGDSGTGHPTKIYLEYTGSLTPGSQESLPNDTCSNFLELKKGALCA